jgi:C-terminal processing protease CtpA/Prc
MKPDTSNEDTGQAACFGPTMASHHKVKGIWLGTLNVFSLELLVIFRISQNNQGELAGTVDSPAQGVVSVAADKITLTDGILHVEVKGIPCVFEGKIKGDGSIIEGKWKQSGYDFPLMVRRACEGELLEVLEDRSYTKVLPSDELKQDLDFLFKTIEEVHPNMYAYTTEHEFLQLREPLYQRVAGPMSRLEFYKAVAPVVASLKNGHTSMHPPLEAFNEYLSKGGRIFPLELHWDGTDVILKSCLSRDGVPIGGKLLTIDGLNAGDFLVRAARYYPAENRAYDLAFLENPEMLSMSLWFEKGNADSMTISSETMDGVIEEHIIKSLTQKEIESHSVANVIKDATESSDENPHYSYSYISEHQTRLIKFNACVDLEKFETFLLETFGKIKEQGPGSLIIDVRKNSGGHSSLGNAFLKYLTDKPFRQFEKSELKISHQIREQYKFIGHEGPDGRIGSLKLAEGEFEEPGENPLRYKGRVFLLIGPNTASSATSFAAAVKHFLIGTLIGRETKDTLVCYGEIVYATLPNTGLGVSVACKHFVEAGGKPDGRGVIPDFEVRQNREGTAKGIDTVLQFTLDLIKRSSDRIRSTPDK